MRLRRLVWALSTLLVAAMLGVGGLTLVASQLGRTPGELAEYAERRLEGHPALRPIARPLIDGLRAWAGEPDAVERALPFTVPPLPTNPVALDGDLGTPGDAVAKLIRVGSSRTVKRIADAAALVADGSTIEIDPGDYVADVATWPRANFTIRGLGRSVRLIAGGAAAQGKAIWVFTGGRVTVENIEFVGARVPDRNGAAIRLEAGHLLVRRCRFFDNESGILTGTLPSTVLEVEQSEFAYSGAGDGLSHAIYVGSIERFRLSASYIHHANVGHLVKSRARHNRIEYNRLTDEVGGRASYELEIANGGVAEIVGNLVQQGEASRNSVVVSYGAEGYRWPVNRLQLAHNTLVNDKRHGGTFVRVAEGAQPLLSRNNLFVGPGRRHEAAAVDSAGDEDAAWPDFVRPSREDFRLGTQARERLRARRQGALEPALTPTAEYRHPADRADLGGPATLPGAFQSGEP